MTGEGILADQISQLFRLCVKRFKLDRERGPLNTRAFRRQISDQLQLL